MRLSMERGTTSILQYQLPMATILTRRMPGSSLHQPITYPHLRSCCLLRSNNGGTSQGKAVTNRTCTHAGDEHIQARSSSRNGNTDP
jgi:hypothetical protein